MDTVLILLSFELGALIGLWSAVYVLEKRVCMGCGELNIFTGWVWLSVGVLVGAVITAILTMARE